MERALPTVAGRYAIESALGAGSTGTVYRARRLADDVSVALKVLRHELDDDPELLARFRQELKVMAAMDHPNVVRLLDHGRTDQGGHYLVMEILAGKSLGDLLLEDVSPMSAERVASIGRQIAEGLSAIHARGVVHRDLKPDNVFVEGDRVKIVDFGLSLVPKLDARLTASGLRVGTPAYMAPEYIGGSDPGPSADLYALGVMLYELASGEPPFSGAPYDVLNAHLCDEPPSVAALEEAPWLAQAIRSLLAKDPSRRPRDAAAARRLLHPPPPKPPQLSGAVLGAALLFAMSLFALALAVGGVTVIVLLLRLS